MEKFEQYRDNLAEKIKDAPKENREEILKTAKQTEDYDEAREEKLREVREILNKPEAIDLMPESLDPDEARTWGEVEQKIDMPHVLGISQKVEEQYKKEGGQYDPEITKDILYAFLEKGINNTKIYSSEKHKASFPYTSVDTSEIAKSLYRVYGGREIGELKPSQNTEGVSKKRTEFLFGSFQLISHGNQFTFTEEILHQIFKDLPAAIEKIEKGEEPDKNEIFTVGSPTTTTGTMSEDFLDEVKVDAFGSYGDMYAELVESVLSDEHNGKEKTNLALYGISMGASFAGQTAKKVLEDGYVTQSRENENIPFMQVRIDTAPGHRSKPGFLSKMKVFGGFAASTILTLSTDKYTRDVIFKNGKYMAQVNQLLAEKGLAESNLSSDQIKMKKTAIGAVESSLAKGVPWPEGVKATEVVGLTDALTYDSKLNKSAYEQRKTVQNSLGTYAVPEQSSDDIRVRSAEMTHAIPFTQRENEKKRMYAAVVSLEKLKKGHGTPSFKN